MEIKNLQRIERKDVKISLRTFKSYSKFMKDKNLSPTLIFNEAVKELMKKNK